MGNDQQQLKPILSGNLEKTISESDLKKLRDSIDTGLLKLAFKIRRFGLSDQMNYAVLSYGKRLRPIMTLLSTGCVGGNLDEAIDFALALELLHTATLVHDDILDNDVERRGLSTVHRKWSLGEAVLAGDALLSLALSLVSGYEKNTLKVFSETGMLLAEGEHLDFVSSKSCSEEEYFERIQKKSAVLFGAATKCGALIGKGSELEVSSLGSFGDNFGIAYQIRDDLMDLIDVGGFEKIPVDLKEHRMTLPIINLLESLDEQSRNDVYALLEILANEKDSNRLAAFKALLNLLQKKGSVVYCQKKVNSFIDSAIENLEPINETVFKRHLKEIAESLVFE